MAAYFLAVFLWLLFCYGQVQKACLEAGHTVQGTALEVVPLWGDGSSLTKWGDAFFENFVKNGETIFEGGMFLQPEKEREGSKKSSGEENAEKTEKNAAEGEIFGAGENTEEKEKPDPERIRVVLLGEDGVYHKKIRLEAEGEKLEIAPD